MRAVVQRVSRARVTVGSEQTGAIGRGLLALVGVARDDAESDAAWLAEKIVTLRVFEDAEGKMNRALGEVHGAGLLAVSQFTLLGDARKGRRPSFVNAAPPEQAEALFLKLCDAAKRLGVEVATGRFRAHMEIELVNDGPVTILLDSKRTF